MLASRLASLGGKPSRAFAIVESREANALASSQPHPAWTRLSRWTAARMMMRQNHPPRPRPPPLLTLLGTTNNGGFGEHAAGCSGRRLIHISAPGSGSQLLFLELFECGAADCRSPAPPRLNASASFSINDRLFVLCAVQAQVEPVEASCAEYGPSSVLPAPELAG